MGTAFSQHINSLKVSLEEDTKELNIQQEFEYHNTSKDSLYTLYFNDWANAYSDKNTALAKRFDEEFKKSLHLAKDKDRGKTQIFSVVDNEYRATSWERTEGKDLIKIILNRALAPGEKAKLFMTYSVKLPPNRYTPYGYNSNGDYYLKDWYLTPAVYDKTWLLYSNKNLEDLYTGNTNTSIIFTYPDSLFLGTNFHEVSITKLPGKLQASLVGVNRKSCDIILNTNKKFIKHVTPELIVVTDIQAVKYDEISQGVSINRITKFINNYLGDYPYEQLLVSNVDFLKNPLYGLNQLPSFIRPYEKQFQFEMKFLKTALNSYMRETIFLNPRKEKWVEDALVNYLMIRFVEVYYPDQKLLGKLSKFWLIKGFHLAQMDFNEQYSFLYMLMARRNLDQSLITQNDSLIKFNQKIANTYKAGLGLAYLADYTGVENVDKSVKEFYKEYNLKPVDTKDFESVLKKNLPKDIDWFFNSYVATNDRIDYKIKKIEKTEDSLYVTLKNKTGVDVPISLFGINKDEVVSKYWFTGIK
ncbi:MAG: metalloprotease, partial [Eudoraea sp.]